MKRRAAIAALGIAVAAALGALWWDLHSFSPPDHVLLPRVAWPAGQRAVYRIDLRSSDTVVPMAGAGPGAIGAAISTDLELRGELEIENRGPTAPGHGDSGQTVAVRLRRCDHARLSVADTAAWSGAKDCQAALGDAVLVVDVAPSGRIVEVRDPAEQDALASSMLQFLIMEMQTNMASEPIVLGDSWQTEEDAPVGTLSHSYRLAEEAGGDAQPWRIERSLAGARELSAARGLDTAPVADASGHHNIALSAQGLLLSVVGGRRVSATTADRGPVLSSSSSVRVELVGLEALRATPPSPANLVSRKPTEPRTGSGADRQILDSRIAGLTRDEMNRTLLQYGNAGKLPDHNRFLWRLTGYLERHPEHARDLLAAYRRPEASHLLQGLVLDVLASVGHPVAQEVMREALSVGAPLDDPRGRRLYQRLGLLEQPTAATAQTVERDYLERRALLDQPEARLASAYSLGAIAGKLDADSPERAQRYRDWLVADLARADGNTERVHYVRALSNARGDGLVEQLEPYAASASPEVRAAVARALGDAGQEGRAALLRELVADRDAMVQREALQSSASEIGGAPPNAETLDALRSVAESGRLDRLNVRRVLEIAARSRAAQPGQVRGLLQALLEGGIDDPQLLAVAVRMRESLR